MTNNKTVNNANANNDFIEKLLAETEAQYQEAMKLTENIRENRKNIVENDTAFAVVMASNGYVAVTFGSKDGKVQIRPIVGTADKLTSAAATLAGAYTALEKLKECEKNHVTLYVSDYEARRVAGMISRINTESMAFLTQKEMEFISARPTQFGDAYIANAKKLFLALAYMKQKLGKTVRVVALSGVHGYAINRAYNLPQGLAEKTLTFRNGRALATVDGRNYAVVAAGGLRLNGDHKIVIQNNTLCIERAMEPGSEQEFVQNLWTISARLITVHRANSSAKTYGVAVAE